MQHDTLAMPLLAFIINQSRLEHTKLLNELSDKQPNEETIFKEAEIFKNLETLETIHHYLQVTSEEQFQVLIKHFDKATIEVLYTVMTKAHNSIASIKHHLIERKELLTR
jgi:5-formyltetrahydrofolate cyclo-ligase